MPDLLQISDERRDGFGVVDVLDVPAPDHRVIAADRLAAGIPFDVTGKAGHPEQG